MNLIKKLDDNDFNIKKQKFKNPRIRYGARGLIFNQEGKIAILYKKNKNEYKLIGGGIKENETNSNAFLREAEEKTGFKIKIDYLLGVTLELKSLDNFIQKSYVYVAHTLYDNKSQNLTEEEKQDGSILLWLDIIEATKLVKDSINHLSPSKNEGRMSIYHTKYIVKRDYEILKYFIKLTSVLNEKKHKLKN